MGLFDFLRGAKAAPKPTPSSQPTASKATPKTAPAQQRRVVTVAYRDLDHPNPLGNFNPEYGYAFYWPFPQTPKVGDWAIASGSSGPTTVIVGKIGRPSSAKGMQLKELTRLLTADEIDRGRR